MFFCYSFSPLSKKKVSQVINKLCFKSNNDSLSNTNESSFMFYPNSQCLRITEKVPLRAKRATFTFCYILLTFAIFLILLRFVLFCFVSFRFVMYCFVLFCYVLLKCDIFGDFQTLCSNVLCVTRLPLPYFFLMIDLWV